MNNPLVIDSFPYNGEEILDIRLNEMKNVCDFHLIVESSFTQSRQKKPFYFEENKDRYKDFLDKIVYVKINQCKSGVYWEQENFIRECIFDGMNQLQSEKNIILKPTDYLLVSDADEIVKGDILQKVVESKPLEPLSFNLYFIAYY